MLLLLSGISESESEKAIKQQVEETKKLRKDINSLNNTDIIQKQAQEIENMKKELEDLKSSKEETDEAETSWLCEYCSKEFQTEKKALIHEKTCKKKK